MPHKSKRKKLLSEYHRKIQSLTPEPTEQTTRQSQPSAEAPVSFKYSIPIRQEGIHESPITTPAMDQEYATVRKDLIHTLILVGVTFIAEILVWRIFG